MTRSSQHSVSSSQHDTLEQPSPTERSPQPRFELHQRVSHMNNEAIVVHITTNQTITPANPSRFLYTIQLCDDTDGSTTNARQSDVPEYQLKEVALLGKNNPFLDGCRKMMEDLPARSTEAASNVSTVTSLHHVRQDTSIINNQSSSLPLHSTMATVRVGEEPIKVLLLGGWTCAPLDFLQKQSYLQKRQNTKYYKPALHTPPSGLLWLYTWEFALLLFYLLFIIFPMMVSPHFNFVPTFIATILVVPLLVVQLVKGCIRRCIDLSAKIIQEENIDLVVGFSWGGGIGCWLLSEQIWDGPTLLLCPAVQAMMIASGNLEMWREICGRKDESESIPVSPFSKQQEELEEEDPYYHRHLEDPQRKNTKNPMKFHLSSSSSSSRDSIVGPIHIFHATVDPFCPTSQSNKIILHNNEDGGNGIGGVLNMHICRDGHLLNHPVSERYIWKIYCEMLDLIVKRRRK